MNLTERQENELKYHKEHARLNSAILNETFAWDVVTSTRRRWWNAYWDMYTYLARLDLRAKRVLIVGCGFGEDAIRVKRLGADVFAFDLSPDSIEIARALSAREEMNITFEEMSAEQLKYESNFFDCIVARDILHHVDIPLAMNEIIRVAKPNALFIVNEIYSHSVTYRIRHSNIVERVLYPLMQNLIYRGKKPYITQDERKLNELDIKIIQKPLRSLALNKYFNFLVTRIVPDGIPIVSKLDRISLMLLAPFAKFIAGRIFFAGRFSKESEDVS